MNTATLPLFELSTPLPKHPASYSLGLLPDIARMLCGYERILDPMAGQGERLLSIRPDAYLNELEPEWQARSAVRSKRSYVGDAHHLQWPDGYFDAIVTSPTYGNRMADHHEAKDASVRHTYRHYLGRKLHPNNSGQLGFGKPYQDFHVKAWCECHRVLRDGGAFVLNVKDHMCGWQRIPVTDWHIATLAALGFRLVEHVRVDVPGMRFGQNADERVEYESVILFERGLAA